MKSVLLIAPTFLNLYIDLKIEWEKRGYNVTYIEEESYSFDPSLIRNKQLSHWKEKLYIQFLKKKNIQLYEKKLKGKTFDYLMVINGKSFHPILLDQIRRDNPKVKTVLYLWDRTYKNYRFDRNFDCFDRVATFDREDAKQFNLEFLPLYWIEGDRSQCVKYKIFAFGSYRNDRKTIFELLYKVAIENELPVYIKLYIPSVSKSLLSRIKTVVKEIIKRKSCNDCNQDILIHEPLSPSEFRKCIYSSLCVIDTYNDFQEGMTPRFMWALGAGRKIITTNKNVINYPFYSPDRILVIDNMVDTASLLLFLDEKVNENKQIEDLIVQYRIDNWMNYLLCGKEKRASVCEDGL